jgi:predicted dehydrogenase
MHYAMAREALLSGKHVYVEKPMTLTAEHAEDLVALAEQQKRKLMVGHLLVYHPAVEYIKRLIDTGELGEILYMYCQRLNLGVVRQQENAFWSLAPHDISVILHLFSDEPNGIVSSGECYLQPDIEDVVFVNLHFADGRMAQIHVSWLDPHKERKMVVVGSKKMLVFDDMQPAEKIRIFDKTALVNADSPSTMQAISVRHGDILLPFVAGPEPLEAETKHFIDAIRTDSQPRSDGHAGLRVVRILEQVHQQLRAAPRIHRLGHQRTHAA